MLSHSRSDFGLIIHRELISAVNIKFRYFPLCWFWSGSYIECNEIGEPVSTPALFAKATMRKPRTYKQLQQDPRVADWSDERSGGIHNDGLWIYLAPGWVTAFEGQTTIHEDTVAACCLDVSLAEYNPEAWAEHQRWCGTQNPWLLPAG